MKIFGHSYEIDNLKFLYTKRIFQILQKIKIENKEILILTPFTKYSDIFNFKKENSFMEILNTEVQDYREKLVNETFLSALVLKINQLFNFDVLDYNLDYEKLTKTILTISHDFIDEAILPLILKILNQFVNKCTEIVIAGFKNFNPQIYENLEIVYVTDDLKNTTVNFHNLEMLLIDNIKNNKIFAVEDGEKLLRWIELESKTIITQKQFNNYLNGNLDFISFLIENSLQKIVQIDL